MARTPADNVPDVIAPLSFTRLLDSVDEVVSNLRIAQGMFPVYHIPITKNSGIDIIGKFSTNNSFTPASVSYVTVGRQSDRTYVGEGLGFAWRRSALIPNTYDANGDVLTQRYDYNCYIVDNSILSEETFISAGNLVVDGGLNNYIGGNNILVYGSRIISSNVTYQFKMRITSNYEVTVWILDNGLDVDLVEDTPYSADPITGAPSNQYGWVLKKSSSDPIYAPNASGTHFGISVMNTKSNSWTYSDLKITSITEDHPVALFKLDASPSYFHDDDQFHVFWKGWGNWNDSDHGAALYIWNTSTEGWELIGSNAAEQTSPEIDKVISGTIENMSDYRDSDDFSTLLATSTTADSLAEINSSYISLENFSVSGIHTGGMVDIYVNAPDKILTANNSIVVPLSGVVTISEGNGFQLPFHSIVSITSDVTGDELIEAIDYQLIVDDTKRAWSTSTAFSLTFTNAPATVTVLYRYFSQGGEIQDFIDNEDYRNPGVSPLIKLKPPAIISVDSLSYRGNVDEVVIKNKLAEWINDLIGSLEISDMVNFLYDEGVNYINLNTLSVLRKTYDYQGTLIESGTEISDTYTLSGIQAFYTDILELYGVTKIG